MIANIYEVTTQQLKDLKFTFPSNAYIFLYTSIPRTLNFKWLYVASIHGLLDICITKIYSSYSW